MIKLNNVTKKYGSRIIIRDCNYEFSGSGIHCIVGENGSGKSTLLGIISGCIVPTSGEIVFVDQQNENEKKSLYSNIAYVPDACPIYPFITGEEFIALIRSIREVPQDAVDALVDQFSLNEHMKTPDANLSLGTVKKIMLISALMTDSKVLIFDEPTNGLDAKSVAIFKHLLIELEQERLIIMTCHELTIRSNLNAIELSMDLFR
ncbi:ABC transporter ATP-binding protein [Acinetobacter sp. IK25]|uniref:ABC transporter ATP-binding protein n=1 Tax=Acinetobacter sp. IK25 TaxID=2928894 RepID=UPI002D2008AE|nr:ABC transporter ATP-binding protein [Acinetobacter sp. IK25]MEB3838758.1 ABC transporter ATP-binding protein [Acinetobacter sp. IK25]